MRSTGWAVAATLTERLAALAIALWLPRYLPLQEYGEYALAVTLLALFQSLPDGGVESVLVAGLSRDVPRMATLAGAAVPLRGTVSLGCGLVGLATLALVTGGTALPAAAAPWSLGLFLVAANPYRALLRAEMRFRRYLAAVTAQAGGTLLALGAVVWTGGGLRGVLATGIAGALAGWGVGRVVAGRSVRPRFDVPAWRLLLRGAMPVVATGAVMVAAQQLLVVLLLRTHGSAAVGLFAGAQRVIDAVNLLPQAFAGGLLPLLARGSRTDRETSRAMTRLALVVFPLAATLVLGADPLLRLALGAPFAAAAPTLRVLALAAVLGASGQVLTVRLIADGLERPLLAATGASAAVMTVLGLPLVPPWGGPGAAVAVVAGMLTGQLVLVGTRTTRRAGVAVVRGLGAPLAVTAIALAVSSLGDARHGLGGLAVFAIAYLAAAAGLLGFRRRGGATGRSASAARGRPRA